MAKQFNITEEQMHRQLVTIIHSLALATVR